MKSIGVCASKSCCHIVLVDWDDTARACSVIAKAEIAPPASYAREGAILDYFRAESDTFLKSVGRHRDDLHYGGVWVYELPRQGVTDERKVAIRIEGVVLAAIFENLSLELVQLRSKSVFSKARLSGRDVFDLQGIAKLVDEPSDATLKAIAAAVSATMG